jgi:hypothetical protein
LAAIEHAIKTGEAGDAFLQLLVVDLTEPDERQTQVAGPRRKGSSVRA